MKALLSFTSLILFIVIVFIGCSPNNGPYEMYTRVNPDGSCYREFIRNVDSAFVAGDTAKNPFPVKLDSSWKVRFYKRIDGDSSGLNKYPAVNKYKQNDTSYAYFAIAGKEYPTIKDLSESFRYSDSKGWEKIRPSITLDKKFHWFYTYYAFRETYHAINVFHLVPVEKYLSADEIDALYGENSTLFKGKNGIEIRDMIDKLEEKSNSWLNRNLYEENFNIFLDSLSKFHDLPVDSSTFAMSRDTIYSLFKDSLELSGNDFVDIIDRYFHTDAFSRHHFDKIGESVMNQKLSDFISVFEMEINYKLSVPGKVIETNAPFMGGDTLSWKLDANRIFLKDYIISAESRKPNFWAFGLTGVVVILSLLGFLLKRKPV